MSEQNPYPHYSLREDYVLWVLLAALIVLTAIAPDKIISYPQRVDWSTIQTLLGLLILTKGIEASGWLSRVSARIALHIRSERTLALFLMASSALLAMLLTNDIALFIMVPLTLSLGAIMLLPLRRLVIFEALAVNAGSLLTPIGNPQNIFLWQHADVGFGAFVWRMLPLCAMCLITLGAFGCAAFKARPVHANEPQHQPLLDRRVLLVSALFYLPFLILADLHHTALALGLVAVVFLAGAPRILRRIDWPLVVVFVLMFIDLRLLTEQAWMTRALATLDMQRPGSVFVVGALLSQGISNVPAAILLAHYSNDWSALAWGVNVGGFGLLIGSLANIIALRIGRQHGSLRAFHAWSLPFFLTVGALAWLWLRLAGT
ncbi:MAG TPA: SLC13 family permease [Gammaproteobacteria bacterium]|nr:SLC13 family permease [Gammaproteobacteria bacterium]